MAESTPPQPPTAANPSQAPAETGQTVAPVNANLPRVAIKYCTQCRWMLRAAYFAQELLSTFSTSIGEIALIPSTGGIFTVTITTATASSSSSGEEPQEVLLWDRKRDGGFPDTKQLKALVRNVIDPARDLGHVDRALTKKGEAGGGGGGKQQGQEKEGSGKAEGVECEDCK